ncbi:hypothetical protein [Haloarcula sediminis]|uniref:hypothetical protein n=1 Tax=Haloarcula sediminis TaxID=3111777 RepID=UPI002D79B0A4|nr:hypothetical protein [Haloarcula sp. CK38]
MTVTFTEDDEGKIVVDAGETTLGRVSEVGTETVSVDPDPGLADSLLSDLGWGSTTDEDYTVHQDAVDTKTDEKIYLQGHL